MVKLTPPPHPKGLRINRIIMNSNSLSVEFSFDCLALFFSLSPSLSLLVYISLTLSLDALIPGPKLFESHRTIRHWSTIIYYINTLDDRS